MNKVSSEEYKGGKHDKIYTPRDEEAFCNFVAAHLKRDLTIRGIVINREVQIRVNPGAKGERTDIHVDAIAKSGQSANYERLSVVIEAKGSWNSEIDTAMESQLVDQYLKESACQSGIYLIGYFNCPQWDSADYRKSVSERYNLNDLNSLLHSQALNLSDEPMSVIPFILDASLKS